VWECTFAELDARFGQNRWVQDGDREILRQERGSHTARLRDYLDAIRRVGIPAYLLIDGSFVTDKPDPGDIDLAIVLPADHNFASDLSVRDYNLLSKRRVRQGKYPFDLFVVADGSTRYHEVVTLFHRVKGRPDLRKGFLRVKR
jgi:hypothetical protein